MIAVIDCGSSKVPDIAALLESFGQQTTTIPMQELPSKDLNQYKGVVFSGNPNLIKDNPPETFLPYFHFLEDYQKPVLGICFGHQVLGLVFGAKASTGKEDREIRSINILQHHPLFKSLPPAPTFQQDHCEEVTLPENFTLLANSSHCPNEAMAHNTKPFYGVQFHPESRSIGTGENGKILLQNFCALL